MAKVYVSSTIADLKPERQAVLDWLRAARHLAVDSYLPDSDTVRDSCLDDVAACDLYVLILGHRYGFVPADDNPERLSITQLEFRRAGECGIPRIALLRTSIPDERLADLQDPAKAALVWAFRAEVAHAVRPAEFSDQAGLIQGLSTGIQAALAKLAQQPAGQATAGRVLRLAPRPVFLAGREELLAELDTRLAAGDEGAGPRVVALYGLGGAGKTSVALEYAHRHLAECGVVWQLPAEDATVLAGGLSELAAELGLADGPDAGNPVARLHAALVRRDDWLLIFDSVPDPAAIDGWLPPAGRGRVLITSQYPFWPGGQALEVRLLNQATAAEFLMTRTDASADEEAAAVELAGELDGLPLALEQAAAYMRATGRDIPGYLELFREWWVELLARGELIGYDKRVTTTWAVAFTEVGQSGPASGLLRLVACCAAEYIPLRLLLRPRPGLAAAVGAEVAPLLMPLLNDPIACDDAVAGLRRYSLISAPHHGIVSVHRLVQKITMAQLDLGVAEDWRRGAAALIEAALPDDADDPANWPVFAVLLPHAQTALTSASYGIDKAATYLRAIGEHRTALDLQRQILTACDLDLGAKHPRTLTARASLATLTGEAGAPAAARDQFAELLPVLTLVLGAEHPATLRARASLAYWTGETGAPAAARDQFAELLLVLTRVLGAEHPATLAARRNLARSTGDAADAAGARNQFAALLPIQERVSGGRHPDTLTVRASLAHWTGMAGDPAVARDQYAELVPIREQLLGAEHPRTLVARAGLARWTGKAGDPAGARDQYAELLPLLERVLGVEHPDTRDARASLAQGAREAESG
jgi:hypothetical protein